MIFTLIVHSAPDTGGGSQTALHFARTLHRLGHTLKQVFFYHEGVRNALGSQVSPQDESDLLSQWQALAQSTQAQLAVCIAAATRRGVLNADEADRLQRISTLAEPFELVGLGQLIEATMTADRCITFVN